MGVVTGNIIIVEDDRDDQAILEMAFNKLDLPNKLLLFNNGEEALKYLQNPLNPIPFIIFSDINMPRMNGIELLQEIQDDPILKAKAIPFVFLSSSSSQEDIKKAYFYSAQGYFEKPVAYKEVLMNLELIIKYWTRCLHPKVD
jgi:CheY-like chemotaxis protein